MGNEGSIDAASLENKGILESGIAELSPSEHAGPSSSFQIPQKPSNLEDLDPPPSKAGSSERDALMKSGKSEFRDLLAYSVTRAESISEFLSREICIDVSTLSIAKGIDDRIQWNQKLLHSKRNGEEELKNLNQKNSVPMSLYEEANKSYNRDVVHVTDSIYAEIEFRREELSHLQKELEEEKRELEQMKKEKQIQD